MASSSTRTVHTGQPGGDEVQGGIIIIISGSYPTFLMVIQRRDIPVGPLVTSSNRGCTMCFNRGTYQVKETASARMCGIQGINYR